MANFFVFFISKIFSVVNIKSPSFSIYEIFDFSKPDSLTLNEASFRCIEFSLIDILILPFSNISLSIFSRLILKFPFKFPRNSGYKLSKKYKKSSIKKFNFFRIKIISDSK